MVSTTAIKQGVVATGTKIKQGVVSTGTTIKQGVVSTGTKIAEGVRDFTRAAKAGDFSTFSLIFVIAIFVTVMVFYYKQIRAWLSPDVLRDRVILHVGSSEKALAPVMNQRQSLETQLAGWSSPPLFSDLYVSTANGTGLFFPARDGVFSPDAVRQVVRAGARCFVLEVWPDLSPQGGFAPILQVVEAGSTWRRISLNSLPLDVALSALQTSLQGGGLVGTGSAPNKDVIVLYFRFMGSPRKETFNITARVLRSHFEAYRLNPSYTVANQRNLYMTPISQLAGKVVVLANTPALDTDMEDYVNAVPREWTLEELRALPESQKTATREQIKAQLNVLAPPLDSEGANKAESNYMWGTLGRDMGIQFMAMNFFAEGDKNLAEYLSPDMFGSRSYVAKPTSLRMKPEVLQPPRVTSGNRALQQTIGTDDVGVGALGPAA